jgi:ADP-ribosylglycohydrolase
MAAYADLVAARLDGIVLPTAVDLDHALTNPRTDQNASGPALRQMFIFAKHLAQRQGNLDDDALAAELSADRAAVTRGASALVLGEARAKGQWWELAPKLHQGNGSYGSTAPVRAMAAGMLPASLGKIAELAQRSSVLTHTHPVAGSASAAIACATALALQDKPDPIMTVDRFLGVALGQRQRPESAHYLAVVRTLTRHRAGPAETTATLSPAPTALRAVLAALTAYLRHDRDPLAVIRYAAAIGGNTRNSVIMAAVLAGGRNPRYQPPPAWTASTNSLPIHLLAGGLAAVELPAQPRPAR